MVTSILIDRSWFEMA